MKCNQTRPGFELVSPCSFPKTVTITPRAPPFVEHNRHFLSTYFLVDPFILPYWFYRVRRELIDVFSLIVYISNTFCPTLGNHQGRIYYKSDVTFVVFFFSCPTTELRKFLTDNTILEHQNNKQKLQILEALHIWFMQPTLNRINF